MQDEINVSGVENMEFSSTDISSWDATLNKEVLLIA